MMSKKSNKGGKATTTTKRPQGRSIEKGVANLVKTAVEIKKLFNHPEWYTKYEKGLVNLNFGRRRGITEPTYGAAWSGAEGDGVINASIPTCASFDINLVKPINDNEGWNTGMQMMYANMRSANSGSTNYKPKTLEQYILHVRAMHAMYGQAKLALELVNNYDLYDAGMPELMFAAMGLDFNSISQNSANLYNYLVQYHTVMSKLCPLNLSLIDRTKWICGTIFKDSDDAKSGYYIPRVESYLRWDGDNMSVKFRELDYSYGTGIIYELLVEELDALKNQFISRSDFQIVAGDLIKAFGQSAFTELAPPVFNGAVSEIYDPYLLSQLQNATLFSAGSNEGARPMQFTFTSQGTDLYVQTAKVSLSGLPADLDTVRNIADAPFVNSPKDEITPGEVMSLTRLAITTKVDEMTGDWEVTSCGTEIISNLAYFTYQDLGTNIDDRITRTPLYGLNFFTSMVNIEDRFAALRLVSLPALWASLDMGPKFILMGNFYKGSSEIFGSPVIWDFNNYAKFTINDSPTIFGIGNMSLLYSDPLIDQNRSRLFKGHSGYKK